jgi:prepilin-type N-terminal cleavage/methylation domain-containing protein
MKFFGMRKNCKSEKRIQGFSLIEILVSLAIFAMVVTAGTSAIMSAITSNQKAQSLNSVVTNLNLALESMAREIRLGGSYVSSSASSIEFDLDETDQYGCSKREYYVPSGGSQIYIRRFGGCTSFSEPFTAAEVQINSLGFQVCKNNSCDTTGVSPRQPYVLIRINGVIAGKSGTGTDFTLQTLVSQRLLEDDEV